MHSHPFADLFPMLPADELRRLADDIKANGLRQPIIVDRKERIIDGRNRQAACELAGVDPVYEPFTGNDSAVLKLVVSLNIHRRHLTESQRAMVAASVANLPKHAHKPKKSDVQICPSEEPAVTVAEAAESLAVSPRSVKSARKVKDKGTPELQQAVIDGDIAVSAAAAIADIPKEQQREVVEAITSPEKKPKAEKKPYDVIDDVNKFEKLKERLSPNWVEENHKAAIRYKLRQMANEV